MAANEPPRRKSQEQDSEPRFVFKEDAIFDAGRNHAEIGRDLFKIFVTTSNARTYIICFCEGYISSSKCSFVESKVKTNCLTKNRE